MTIIWTNLVDPESLTLYTKILPQNSLDSRKEIFKYFYHKWATLFNGAESFEQIVNTLSTGPMWNQEKIAQAVSEMKTFKNYTIFIHVYSPEARTDNPQGTKVWL